MVHGVRSRAEVMGARVDADVRSRLTLLGGFQLSWAGEHVALPVPAQRLVAFLALHASPVSRAHAAGSLWLDTTQGRALANLRSAVWRARSCADGLVQGTSDQLRLADGLEVDAQEAAFRAQRLIDEMSACPGRELFIGAIAEELLPDWLDEWVVFEREGLHQLFTHALEALTRRLSALGRHAHAIQAATIAVQREPLRESAHRTLIDAHLAEGNRYEALRQYRTYRRVMRDELGLEPSTALQQRLKWALNRP